MADTYINLPFQLMSLSTYSGNESNSSAEEAIPSVCHPQPSLIPSVEPFSTMLDPSLLVTPERHTKFTERAAYLASSSLVGDDSTLCGRTTRVHFNQNVAVHQISPDSANFPVSPDSHMIESSEQDDSTSDNIVCHELDLTNLSDSEPVNVIAADLRNTLMAFSNPNVISSLKSSDSTKQANGIPSHSGKKPGSSELKQRLAKSLLKSGHGRKSLSNSGSHEIRTGKRSSSKS